MPEDNCLVCATNEGVFVDVEEQPELKDKVKSCQLDKVWEESETTKVCHKCAFEIDQCSVFVKKVKKAGNAKNAKKDCCVLCFDTQDKDIYLFDLSKQKNGVNGLIQRLQDQFSDELKNKELKKQFICLSCRYCVDLLADLRTLLDEVPSKLKSVLKDGIDPADLPKTKTIIASRKTTYIQSSDLHLNTPSDTDSDTSSIMSSKKKANKASKSSQISQKCEQCKQPFDNIADTYRLFKTGKKLCKQCWLSTDFNKILSKRRKKVNYPATQLCSIVLKDLYQISHNSQYTVTEDKKGNAIFKVISNEMSDVQHKESDNTEVMISRKSASKERQSKDIEENEETSVKSTKVTRHRKDSEQSNQESVDVKLTRSRRRQDSEQSVQEVTEHRPLRSGRRRKESEQSVQEESYIKPTRNRNRTNSEQSVQSVEEKMSSRLRRKDSEKSEQEEIEIDVDVDSDHGSLRKRARQSTATQSKVQDESAGFKRKRGRSSSIESVVNVRKSARNSKKHTHPLEEIIEIDDDLSDIDKVQKEFIRPKRSRKENTVSNDDRSDAGSEKIELHKNSPMSSKEPTPERQSVSSSPKKFEDSTNVVTVVQINETQKKEFESSESEEIDVLKSTDEESKHDESLEKGKVFKASSDVEIVSEYDVSDKSIEKINYSALKAVSDSQPNNEINEDALSDVKAKSLNGENPEIIEENTTEKSIERDVVETKRKNNDDSINVSKNKSEAEDNDVSDDGKENKAVLKQRLFKKNARKSKSTGGRKSKKNIIKYSEETTADSSDPELERSIKEPMVTSYTCNLCNKVLDNRYEGLRHEITHAKCLKVSLEKMKVPQKRKPDVNDKVDEKMDIDENTVIANDTENNEDMEKIDEAEKVSEAKQNETVEMTDINDKEYASKIDDFDRIDTVNEDEHESDKTTEYNESETEITPNKRSRRALRRSRAVEEKSVRKSRRRRKNSNDLTEPEVTTAVIEAEPDKIAEAVQETLNDMAELHERIREESASKDQQEEEVTIDQEKENENKADKEPEIVSNGEPEVETVEPEVETGSETEATTTQIQMKISNERFDEIETHDIADDSSRDEIICDSNIESKDKSKDIQPEELEHPIVNLDDEVSRDVVDVESETKKRFEESEVEITEVEDVEPERNTVRPDEVVECEQVDLTEKDDPEDAPKAGNNEDDDDNEIEEITQESNKHANEDENTVDSVTEINVTAATEATVENDAENPRQNDDTDNTTEDEVLAQESLEDLLQRKGLQIVDEFAESVTDCEEESEKEVNVSSEKENSPRKKDQSNNELEIKISDAECTDILEVSNNKMPNKKSIDGEVQITQDVDVVEEVVNDDNDGVQPQNDVEEVEIDSNNVSFNFPKLY